MGYQLEAISYPNEPEANTHHLVAVLTDLANERARQGGTWGDDEYLKLWFERYDELLLHIDEAANSWDTQALRRALLGMSAHMVAAVQALDLLAPTTAPPGCWDA